MKVQESKLIELTHNGILIQNRSSRKWLCCFNRNTQILSEVLPIQEVDEDVNKVKETIANDDSNELGAT